MRTHDFSHRAVRFCLAAFLTLVLFPLTARAGEFDGLPAILAKEGIPAEETRATLAQPWMRYNEAAMGKKLFSLYEGRFGSAFLREFQSKLSSLGFYEAPMDGKLTRETRQAILGYQRAAGLPEDGKPTRELLERITANPVRRPAGMALPEIPAAPKVYAAIVTPERLAEAKAFYDANLPLLRRVEERFGVPPDVAAGLMAVETRLGTFLGDEKAYVNLASMAVARDVSRVPTAFAGEVLTTEQRAWLDEQARKWSEWAAKELAALVRFSKRTGRALGDIPGSIHGAIGVCQFMPTNIPIFGVDGDGDGVVDLFVLQDAVFSMGNYLYKHGFRPGLTTREQKRKAIYGYNHSEVYVNTIMAVSDYLVTGQIPVVDRAPTR